MQTKSLISLAFLLLASACAGNKVPPADKLVLSKTSYDQLPNWQTDRLTEALDSFMRSCGGISGKAPDSMIGKGELEARASIWQDTCRVAQSVPYGNDIAARQFFEGNFRPFIAANNDNPEGLFTGYYEPLLRGSLTRHGPYQVPVYRMPPDRVQGQSYYSRTEIENGAMANRGLEIAWVDDAIDLFFLQIQGSGRLQMDTGEETRLAYAGQNGHEYVAIGKLLRERGELEKQEVSMSTIKGWLRDHPAEGVRLMQENPSYVFFTLNHGDGPKGAQGVVLTPERSLAVDRAYVPLSMPIYLDTTLPYSEEIPYRRLLIAQDTGGAIKGPVRGDIFFGAGERAETLAGYMKNKGRWFFLLPNALAQRIAR